MKFLSLTALLPLIAMTASGFAQDAREAAGYVFSVTVSTPQQLDVVLNRAEDLRTLFNPEEHGKIAIVLHGD